MMKNLFLWKVAVVALFLCFLTHGEYELRYPQVKNMTHSKTIFHLGGLAGEADVLPKPQWQQPSSGNTILLASPEAFSWKVVGAGSSFLTTVINRYQRLIFSNVCASSNPSGGNTLQGASYK